MVLSLHSEIFVVPTYSTEFWSGHQALAGFSPPTCDGAVSPSREVEPTARKSKITPSFFVLFQPSAIRLQPLNLRTRSKNPQSKTLAWSGLLICASTSPQLDLLSLTY